MAPTSSSTEYPTSYSSDPGSTAGAYSTYAPIIPIINRAPYFATELLAFANVYTLQ